jgi:hypothetical protein
MADPATLRDSTQLVLPASVLEDVQDDIESEFVVTVVEGCESARVIGSPVEIKRLSDFLARQGVSVR